MLKASYALNKVGYRAHARDSAAYTEEPILDEYVIGMPTAQNAIDILPGWNQALPPQAGVIAGNVGFYDDARIHWAIEQFGPIAGKTVLELGPLEAAHTFMLDQHAPQIIHSVEANKLAFLRCLVVKEILELKHAKFYLGDFVPWLEQSKIRYDLIIASGVLYHMSNPIRLLELMAERSDAIFIWTHYYDAKAMSPTDHRRLAFIGSTETRMFRGIPVRLHIRSYHGAWQSKAFCGGVSDLHHWIERNDIIAILNALGFDDLRITGDEPNHQNGPSISIFARRTSKTAKL
jgi:hypothetical protein